MIRNPTVYQLPTGGWQHKHCSLIFKTRRGTEAHYVRDHNSGNLTYEPAAPAAVGMTTTRAATRRSEPAAVFNETAVKEEPTHGLRRPTLLSSGSPPSRRSSGTLGP